MNGREAPGLPLSRSRSRSSSRHAGDLKSSLSDGRGPHGRAESLSRSRSQAGGPAPRPGARSQLPRDGGTGGGFGRGKGPNGGLRYLSRGLDGGGPLLAKRGGGESRENLAGLYQDQAGQSKQPRSATDFFPSEYPLAGCKAQQFVYARFVLVASPCRQTHRSRAKVGPALCAECDQSSLRPLSMLRVTAGPRQPIRSEPPAKSVAPDGALLFPVVQ